MLFAAYYFQHYGFIAVCVFKVDIWIDFTFKKAIIMGLNMVFYFMAHMIIGFLCVNASNIQIKAHRSAYYAWPLWLHGQWVTNGIIVMNSVATAAIITTIFQWGIGWAFATFGEIVLGGSIVAFLPMNLRLVLVLVGPIISVLTMCIIWGL